MLYEDLLADVIANPRDGVERKAWILPPVGEAKVRKHETGGR
jgi:hypothetical protein